MVSMALVIQDTQILNNPIASSPSYFVLTNRQTMLSPRRLLEIARKWRKMAALGRKRISWPRRDASRESNTKNTSIANRGHFIVYTSEGRRFTVPLAFLNARMFQELLRLSEEEFGFSGDGPISLPCDAVFLEYVLSLLKKTGPKDAEREMLIFGFMRQCSRSSLDKVGNSQQLAVF